MENGNSRILFITDLVIMFTCFFFVFKHYTGGTMVPLKGNVLMGLIVIYWFLISVNSNILRINRLSKIMTVSKDILIAYSVLSTITIATVAIFGQFRPNDKLLLYPLLFGAIASTALRLLYLVVSKQRLKLGHQLNTVLLIGGGNAARQAIATILATPELGFRIQGVLSDSDPDLPIEGMYAGRLSQFPQLLRRHPIDEVIIAEPSGNTQAIRRIIDQCEEEGVRFCIVPDFYNLIPKWTVLNNLGNLPVIAVRNEPLNIFSNRMIKRAFDILVSCSALLLLAPTMLAIALLIKLTSPGPVFFRQKRIGNNNLEFTLIKFRSMTVQPVRDSNTIWTIPDDHRITPFGKLLRHTNLDELPQLWNVLVGDMSIVGPRPERAYFVEKFSSEIPNYRIRHRVKSGITGLAQANGWRGNTSIRKRIENDLYYLENWSLWLDLKIIFMTFFNPAAWKNAI
jgi:Undecaprenyl-phosphate glucose phosphotransferase